MDRITRARRRRLVGRIRLLLLVLNIPQVWVRNIHLELRIWHLHLEVRHAAGFLRRPASSGVLRRPAADRRKPWRARPEQ